MRIIYSNHSRIYLTVLLIFLASSYFKHNVMAHFVFVFIMNFKNFLGITFRVDLLSALFPMIMAFEFSSSC